MTEGCTRGYYLYAAKRRLWRCYAAFFGVEGSEGFVFVAGASGAGALLRGEDADWQLWCRAPKAYVKAAEPRNKPRSGVEIVASGATRCNRGNAFIELRSCAINVIRTPKRRANLCWGDATAGCTRGYYLYAAKRRLWRCYAAFFGVEGSEGFVFVAGASGAGALLRGEDAPGCIPTGVARILRRSYSCYSGDGCYGCVGSFVTMFAIAFRRIFIIFAL